MNIKLLTPQTATAIDSAKRPEQVLRTEVSAEDRDADGRRERPNTPEKNSLNDQEFDDALKILRETPGLKANKLEVVVDLDGDIRIVSIVAPDGTVVRRMTEAQLWAATRDKDRATGNMLNKKM